MDKIYFNQPEDRFRAFSNLSPHSIFLDGTTWRTCEHYYQGQKYLNSEYRYYVLTTISPYDVMDRGRDTTLPLRSDWQQVKNEIMGKAVRAKINQYFEVRELLLSTGNATIIFHAESDNYWGDSGDGSGKNMLGRLLMQIRDELAKDSPYNELANPLSPPWIKYPDIPRYSIGWRMGAGEGYMCEWGPWYNGLSPSGQQKYQQMNPPPDEWSDFYNDDETE